MTDHIDQDADLGFEEDQPARAGGRSLWARKAQQFVQSRLPLIPDDTTASRALVTVIAIMTFLATLTGGGAVLVYDASKGWDSSISRESTPRMTPTPAIQPASESATQIVSFSTE